MLDDKGEEIELKDDDEDEFTPGFKDESYQTDDSELADSGYYIEQVEEDDLLDGIGFDDDFSDEEE